MILLSKLSSFLTNFLFFIAICEVTALELNNVSYNTTATATATATTEVSKSSSTNTPQQVHSATDNYTYLITGGYRPQQQLLAKYIVSINLPNFKKYFGDAHICGGAIIAPTIIITAAHCFHNSMFEMAWLGTQYRVIAGTPQRFRQTKYTQQRMSSKHILHAQFNKFTHTNDIALLILASPLEINEHTQVIQLATEPVQPDTRCTVLGWGRIFNGGPLTAELLYADVMLWSNTLCSTYRSLYAPGILCAGNLADSEIDACVGDSGGPLICNETLVGIVSFGVGCATPGFPGFYTDVNTFIDWILYRKINAAIKPTALSASWQLFAAFAAWYVL